MLCVSQSIIHGDADGVDVDESDTHSLRSSLIWRSGSDLGGMEVWMTGAMSGMGSR